MSEITINGEQQVVREGIMLSELISQLDLPDARIAIELNKKVVRKKDWEGISISESDVLEIVHFVGGG